MSNFDVNEFLRQPDLRKALDGMATSINVVLNGQQLMDAHGQALGSARVGFALLVFPLEGEQVVVEYRANHDNALWAAAMLRFKAAELAPIPLRERLLQLAQILGSAGGDYRDLRAALEAKLLEEDGHDAPLLLEYWCHGRWAFKQGKTQGDCPDVESTKRAFWLNGWLAEEQR